MGILVGIVGKPSSGKTTFLNALCATDAKTGNYPFTTIEPNQGVGFVTTPCLCNELGVKCNARNSECIDQIRKIPVKVIDVAGLVPGAYEGRGMGNQFLSDLAQADILIHVVDISGSLNEDGEDVEPGTHDPMKDVLFLENEIAQWILGILKKDWIRATRKIKSERGNIVDYITDKLTGLKITRSAVLQAISAVDLSTSTSAEWSDQDLLHLSCQIRKIGKPIIIAANKVDRPTSKANYEKLSAEMRDTIVVPTAALIDIVLEGLKKQKKVEYFSESGRLSVAGDLSPKEEEIIKKIQKEILNEYKTTGVFETLNKAIFDVLNLFPVYPVADVTHFSDKDGLILPDVFLVKKGTTIKEFAGMIHQDFMKNFIYGIDARVNRKISEKHELKSNDVVKIVAAA